MTTPAPDLTPDSDVPPKSAAPARLIVCEREDRWAVALRRELSGADAGLLQTRSLDQCWAALRRWPSSFVVVEVTRTNAAALVERMAWRERDFPLARVAVVADRDLAFCQWLLREAGAVHFTVSPRESGPLARVALRHLDAAPRPQLSLTERIWAGLPWG